MSSSESWSDFEDQIECRFASIIVVVISIITTPHHNFHFDSMSLEPAILSPLVCAKDCWLQEHTGRVFRLQFDDFQIVSSSHDDTIIVWDFLDVSPPQSSESWEVVMHATCPTLLQTWHFSTTGCVCVCRSPYRGFALVSLLGVVGVAGSCCCCYEDRSVTRVVTD